MGVNGILGVSQVHRRLFDEQGQCVGQTWRAGPLRLRLDGFNGGAPIVGRLPVEFVAPDEDQAFGVNRELA